MPFGIAFKRFLAAVRFGQGGFAAKGRALRPLLPALIHDKAVFPLQFAAKAIPLVVITKRFVPGEFFRVNEIVRNMQM